MNKLTSFIVSFNILVLVLSGFSVLAQELPRASPRAILTQIVGLTEVSISYNRPSVKGRKGDIWGDLVSYGEVWRTGANEATVIRFSDDVKLNGVSVKAGAYALLSVPSRQKNKWEIILNADTTLWGTDGYTPQKNIARFNAEAQKHEFTESLTFDIEGLREDEALIRINWEKLRVFFKIEVDTKAKARANIIEAVSKADASDWQVFARSAEYYKDNNLDLEKALEWIEKAIEAKPLHYSVHWIKAEILARKGKRYEALEVALEALRLGYETEGNNFAYAKHLKALIYRLEQKK